MSDEGAATLAAMLASIRGQGAPGTTPAECKNVTPAFLADFNAVRVMACPRQILAKLTIAGALCSIGSAMSCC